MPCKSCGHENRAQARFCESCGNRLDASCPACGNGVAADSRFCDACGQSLTVQPSRQLEAERRQIAVMFCDLVNSTAISQQVDDETLRLIIKDYHVVAGDVIERYGGHVAQYLGDGLLVYFGYPHAHDDDSERAVRAGRDIVVALEQRVDETRQRWNVEVRARVGIHTGGVVVSELGRAGRTETLALGETANIAARLEALADPSSVVISGATLRLVAGLFVTEALGPKALRGIKDPVPVYRVLDPSGVRSRLDVDPEQLSPLVGRDQELGLLTDRWQQITESRGQVVLISGEAGFGKSRLVKSLRESLVSEPHTWLECHCAPYTQNTAMQPIRELVRMGIGLKETDSIESQLQALGSARMLSQLGFPDAVPIIANLLSLDYPNRPPYSAEMMREKTFSLLIDWVLAIAAEQPTIIHFEDLHWADPSTVELIQRLIDECPMSPLMVITTFRPEFTADWPRRSHLSTISLNRLSEKHTRALVEFTLKRRSARAETVEAIASRADGNPLFAEELAKGLVAVELDTGKEHAERLGTSQDIPSSLQGSLMARLDRLGDAKQLAQVCSVLGRTFSADLVRRVSSYDPGKLELDLDRLVDSELLYRHGRTEGTNYTFKHVLIQDIAYQSILRHQRREMHLAAAQTLASDQLRQRAEPEVIARHFDAGGDAKSAIPYYQQAANQLIDRFANLEAMSQLQRALDLIESMDASAERDEQELQLQLSLGNVLQANIAHSDTAIEPIYERARELCSRIGNIDALAPALYGLGVFHTVRGSLDAAIDFAEQLRVLGEETGNPLHRCCGEYRLAEPLFYAGEVQRAADHFRASLAAYEALPGPFPVRDFAVDLGTLAHNYLSWCAWFAGKTSEALGFIAKGIDLAESKEDPMSLSHALTFQAILRSFMRQPEQSAEAAGRAVEVCERFGISFYRTLASMFVAEGNAEYESAAGAPEETVARHVAALEAALADAAKSGQQIGAPYLISRLASIYRLVGRNAEALGTLDFAQAVSDRTGQHFMNSELARMRGELVARGAAEGNPEALFRQAMEIARIQGCTPFELRAALSLTAWLSEVGRKQEGLDLLQPYTTAGSTATADDTDLLTALALTATPVA